MSASGIQRHSPYGGILHEVVEHAGLLHIGGIVAEDLSVGMEEQARDVLGQLDALLSAYGSDRGRVLSTTVFFVDLSEKEAFNRAWTAFFAGHQLPTRAGIGVADLGPGVRVEMTAIAAKA